MKIRPPTDNEMSTLPHIIFSSDDDWDPTILDNISTDDDIHSSESNLGYTDAFDQVGKYKHSLFNEVSILFSHHINTIKIFDIHTTPDPVDYESLRPRFGWAPTDIIKHTFNNTTQYVRSLHMYDDMRKHFKSRFPAFNVMRRNEAVATDTVYSDTPGSKCAQLFVGRETLVTDIYGMKTDKSFIITLEENIRKRGAMDMLISDRGLSEINQKIHDILRAYLIKDWQSEPHHQHQNYAETLLYI
jgi:hypothetical protein